MPLRGFFRRQHRHRGLRYPGIQEHPATGRDQPTAGLLKREVSFNALINLEITNPTNEVAAINQFEYRLLLAGSELATGLINQRVEVPANEGKLIAPILINTNAYGLISSSATRIAFVVKSFEIK